MPKNKKTSMPLQKSTAFWKSLGIIVRKRARTLKNYKPKADMAALKRVGVSHDVVDQVYTKTLSYSDELLFRKFSRFFKKDIETVKVWTNSKTTSQAFIKLFNIFDKNSLEVAKLKFSELALIFEFYKKGESQIFSGDCKATEKLEKFKTSNLRRKLNISDGKADYIDKGSAKFGKERIIWVQKKAESKTTNKFIKLSLGKKVLKVSLSMDSKKEYSITKSEIEKCFNTYLDTPESTKDFTKFTKFLKTGKSENFILTGATYLDSEFRLSITPSYNRVENVTQLDSYKNKLLSTRKKIEFLSQLRLTFLGKFITKPVFVSILTHRDGVFGAVLLRPDDKRLTTQQRRKLFEAFHVDFELPLNEFLKYEDLTDQAIYKYFLQTTPSKVSKIELRSTKAMSIYTSLIKDKLLVEGDTMEEVSKVCVNSTCGNYFKHVWENKKHCSSCGEILINGRTIEIRQIDEDNVARFLKNTFSEGLVVNTRRKLLSRTIGVSQITYMGEVVDFIPISKSLGDNQIEVLKFRYPHSVIITTKDDKDELISKGCQAISLWEVVHSIKTDNSKLLKTIIRKTKTLSLSNMRVLFGKSISRINNDEYYKERNLEVKNLGAELFEADCSILFDYVFGNCLWLGAKYRGVSLPDGFTAFPMIGDKNGCFIWDGKFSEGSKLVMGEFYKNRKYIEEAKANLSIKSNGGLKGFVFISNNTFPPSFPKKYISLTKKRKLKVSFIRAIQFKKVSEHYMRHERLILNNQKARIEFIGSMVDLFFSTSKGRKCEIISDESIDAHISSNESYFATLTTGKKLKV